MQRFDIPTRVARCAVFALALALLAIPAIGQTDWSKVEIGTEKVADGVYMLTGAGGNLGVSAGDDGIFLIDDQFAPLTEKIRAAIAEIDDGEIRFVLNTHWHFDHTGGNENLGEAGTLIVAHDNVRERMSTEQFIEALDMKMEPSPEAALPVVTFTDTVTFHLNGEEIHAFHVPPAHTDGDSVVRFRTANVVHMGDLFFNGSYPFIDLSSGGSVDGYVAGMKRVHDMIADDTKIIPGHGPLASRADLAATIEMLEGVRAAIAKHVEAGHSLEQTLEAQPTAPWDEKWGGGFINPEKMTTIVYQGLAKK